MNDPRTVFITGAAGFMGRALSERFRADDWTVRGVDHLADEPAGIVAGDIGTAGPWQRHVQGAALVVHTAAIVSNAAAFDEGWRVNVGGTRNVLDAAREAGAGRPSDRSRTRRTDRGGATPCRRCGAAAWRDSSGAGLRAARG